MLVLLDLILLAVVASCSEPSPTESSHTPLPLYIWTFDDMDLGMWTNDANNWRQRWAVLAASDIDGTSPALCLRARAALPTQQLTKHQIPWLANRRRIQEPDPSSAPASVRLWSPPIPSDVGMRCLTFQYAFHRCATETTEPADISLALLQRQEGGCVPVVHPVTGEISTTCSNQNLWNSTAVLKRPQSETVWQTAAISLGMAGPADFKLILEGTIPAGYPDARICVDNITSYTEPCSALEPKPVKPASSLNWAHYFGMIFIAALALGLIIPILFLVIIIFVCRRRHQYRHSNFANSKLFSTNLWHYIGGKEVAEDPFAEHTTSFHRPPFMGNKFGDGTLAMRNGDMMDLPDVVIPGGRVVSMGYNGGTLGPNGTMRHQSAASFNGYPYGSATMTMGKPMMGQPGMGYMQPPMSPNMAASQHNAQTMFQPNHFYNGNADPHMQPQQQMTQQPQQMQGTVANNQPPRMQTGAVQQAGPAVVPPSNYFRSLTQAVEDHPAPATHAVQPVTAAAPQPVVAHPPVSSGDHAANSTAPFEDNGPFVLPDPPSDGGHPGAHVASVERDQADAIEALNSATEVSAPATAAAVAAPRPVTTTTTSASTAGEAVYTGEHPPPGYDEAVGMVPSRRDQQKAALPVPAASAVAPVLPPRRAGAGGPFAGNGQPESAAGLSLAERYGLPVADI